MATGIAPHGIYEGVPLTTSNVVPDGELIKIGNPPRQFILGSEWPPIPAAGWHARWIVQQGLLDVLQWLGETPIPRTPNVLPPICQEVLSILRSGRAGRWEDRPRPRDGF